MTDLKILDWLDEDHGLTDDQVAELDAIADEIYARHCTLDPDADDDDPYQTLSDLEQATQDERDAELTIAYRLMVEPPEQIVRDLGSKLRTARHDEAIALAELQRAALVLVDPHGGKGLRGVQSQAGFADRAGVDRATVRDWLGL